MLEHATAPVGLLSAATHPSLMVHPVMMEIPAQVMMCVPPAYALAVPPQQQLPLLPHRAQLLGSQLLATIVIGVMDLSSLIMIIATAVNLIAKGIATAHGTTQTMSLLQPLPIIASLSGANAQMTTIAVQWSDLLCPGSVLRSVQSVDRSLAG